MTLPLKDKTIVVTRAVAQADELISRLKEIGGQVIHIPVIEIVPPDSWDACDSAIDNLAQYHWVIFTSVNGVNFFINRLKSKSKTIDELKSKNIAAVGSTTKSRLQKAGLPVAIMPAKFRADGLIKGFGQIDIQGKGVLIPTAQNNRNVLISYLIARGAQVDVVPVYKNQRPGAKNFSEYEIILNKSTVDIMTFTSPSTVRNFIHIFGESKLYYLCANGCKVAAIGDVTAEAVSEYKLNVDILPQNSTVPGLVEAIKEYYH